MEPSNEGGLRCDFGICDLSLLVLARTHTRDGFRAAASHYVYRAA